MTAGEMLDERAASQRRARVRDYMSSYYLGAQHERERSAAARQCDLTNEYNRGLIDGRRWCTRAFLIGAALAAAFCGVFL